MRTSRTYDYARTGSGKLVVGSLLTGRTITALPGSTWALARDVSKSCREMAAFVDALAIESDPVYDVLNWVRIKGKRP